MRKVNFAAALLALWTMSVAPLVQGKEAQDQAQARAQAMLQSLGFIGPDKAKNMGEIWARARQTLPPESLQKYDRAVSLYRNDPVPQVLINTIEGRGAPEAVKLTVNLGSDTITVELPADANRGLKINGIAFSTEEILNNENSSQDKLISIPFFRNIAVKKKEELIKASIVPSFEQFKAMSPLEWARYRADIGGLLVASENVTNAFASQETADALTSDPKYVNFLRLFIGDQAFALLKGPCTVSGWVTKYNPDKNNNYCSRAQIEKNLDQASLKLYKEATKFCNTKPNYMPCNNNFFVRENGEPICVEVKTGDRNLIHATNTCFTEAMNPRGAAIKGLLFNAGKTAHLDKEGRATSEAAFKDIHEMLIPVNQQIDASMRACQNIPGEPGQKTACNALEATKLLFSVEAFAQAKMRTENDPTNITQAVPALETEKDLGPRQTEKQPEATAPAVPAGASAAKGSGLCFGMIKSDLLCGGLVGATAGGLIGGLIGYGLGKKEANKKNKKKPPVIVKEEVKVKVPGPTIYVERPGPTVYVPKEVIKEVTKEVIKYVPSEGKPKGEPPAGGVTPATK